jgi:hypothetical protein
MFSFLVNFITLPFLSPLLPFSLPPPPNNDEKARNPKKRKLFKKRRKVKKIKK